MLLFGLDYSPARAEAVQRQASRAVKLAPDSLEAAVAMAEAQNRAAQDPGGVLQRMQVLAEQNPNDWRVWRTLGRAALNTEKPELGIGRRGSGPPTSPNKMNHYQRNHARLILKWLTPLLRYLLFADHHRVQRLWQATCVTSIHSNHDVCESEQSCRNPHS